jgi:superfamily II DNA/RNA helicase
MATLEAFRNGDIAFLAASDVAARGLDIPAVSHVFNYDVPVHPEDYVHRIGRTGRAGREGYAAMLVTPKDYKALKAIESMLRQEIVWVDGPPAPEEVSEAESANRIGRGRRRGGRSRRGGERKSANGASGDTRRTRKSDAPSRVKPAVDQPVKLRDKDQAPDARDAQRKDMRRGKQKDTGDDRNDAHRGKPRGMGDHVPAFMMRPVRVS